jgi:hypothetical protein
LNSFEILLDKSNGKGETPTVHLSHIWLGPTKVGRPPGLAAHPRSRGELSMVRGGGGQFRRPVTRYGGGAVQGGPRRGGEATWGADVKRDSPEGLLCGDSGLKSLAGSARPDMGFGKSLE